MPIVSAWVVPHAPVLVPGVSRRAAEGAGDPAVDLSGADVVVVVSPHGRSTGVYLDTSGSLRPFGIPDRSRSAPADEPAAAELAAAWGKPRLAEPLDHGALVPLWWLSGSVPVVACGLAEVTGPSAPASHGELWDEASLLGGAVRALARRRAVALVVSAHLSAGLTAGAPLTELEGAHAFDGRVLDALERAPAELLAWSPQEWVAAGSCGMGPLVTLAAAWTEPLPITSYSHPFGVGYVVAGRVA